MLYYVILYYITHIVYIYIHISVCARLLDTDPTYAKTCLATGRQAPPRKVNKVWSNRKVSVCCLFNTLIPNIIFKNNMKLFGKKCPTLPNKKEWCPGDKKAPWRPGLSISRLWPYFSVGSGDPLLIQVGNHDLVLNWSCWNIFWVSASARELGIFQEQIGASPADFTRYLVVLW